ncbi:flagellar hook-associated protein FlgL [Candidatus Aerophobetes bacterium]|nr:flagellar hook-associated protein FlgL [Candidatus Aerophobetes bacterium]
MRITDAMLSQRIVDSINESKARLGELQKILSTGKRVNKPSDDPLRISSIFNFRKELQEIDQYLRNAETATSWIDVTAQTLSQVSDVLNSARTVALRESNATSTPESRRASAQEVRNLRAQLLNLANTSFGGRYIFSGTKTLTKPFDDNGVYYGDSGEIKVQIEDRQTVTINVPGDEVFQGEEDIFSVLSDLEQALNEGDTQAISSQIGRIDRCLEQIHRWEGEFGGRGKRVEIFKSRLNDKMIGFNKLLSTVEDADVIKIIIELQHAGAAYQAALYAGRGIMQYTLIDFWK